MTEAVGFVYVRRSGDSNLFKIGRSVDVQQRGRQLATGNPERLTLFDTIETEHASECETYLKERLRLRRSRRSAATEFYEVEVEELVAVIDATRAYEREVFANEAEVARLAQAETDERLLPAGEQELELFEELLNARHAEDGARRERERLETKLKLAIGTAAGLDGLVVWRTEWSERLDVAALKDREPAIFARFVQKKPRRTFRLL
jgi:hypothetical protein